jgi:CubicO group peptidase (beta-lactamase class C family)
MVIEKVSGQSYESYLKTNLFDPLEMRNTGYDRPEAVLKFRASGYSNRAGKLENSHIARYVDDDLCLIVLGNLEGPASGRIGQGLAAIVLGREPAQ